MSFPTDLIDTSHMDAGTDSPATAREDLLAVTNAVNAIMSSRGETNGIAGLGADGAVPAAQLSGANIIAALLAADGASSGLDADLLDGLHASAFALLDGTSVFSMAGSEGQIFSRDTSTTASVATAATLRQTTSGTPAAGFGVGLRYRLNSTASVGALAAEINAIWTDATAGSTDAKVAIRAVEAGAIADQAIFDAGHIELRQLSSISGDAPAGRAWIYAKSGGLYVKMPGVSELLLGSGGSGTSAHGSLTGLTNDDHAQYLLVNGSRAMTGELNHGAFSAVFSQLGADPATPSSGVWRLYFKSGGLYAKNSAGTVVGPFGTASGVTAHSGLTGLTTGDDHTQYLLRQPAADVIINNSGGDFNFTIKGDTLANLFVLDAGSDKIFIGDTLGTHSDEGRLNVSNGRSGATTHGLYVESYGASLDAVHAVAAAGGARGIYAIATNLTTSAKAIYGCSDNTGRTVPIIDAECLVGGRSSPVLRAKIPTGTIGRLIEAVVGSGSIFRVTENVVMVNTGGSTSVDFKVLGSDNASRLFYCDVSQDSIGINMDPTGFARLELNAGGSGFAGVSVTGTTASGYYANLTSGTALDVNVTTGYGIIARASDKTGVPGQFTRNTSGSSAAALLYVSNLGSDDGALISGLTAGTGKLFEFKTGSFPGTALFSLENGGELVWKARSTDPSTPASGYISLYAKASQLYLKDSGGVVNTIVQSTNTDTVFTSQYGATITVKQVRTSVTPTGASTTVGTNIIPAGALVLSVVATVVSGTIGGCTSWTAGISSSHDLFGSTTQLTAGAATLQNNASSVARFASADNLVIYPVGGAVSFSGGATVSIVIQYVIFGAPTT